MLADVTEYLDLNYTADQAERDKIFARLCDEEEQLKTLRTRRTVTSPPTKPSRANGSAAGT